MSKQNSTSTGGMGVKVESGATVEKTGKVGRPSTGRSTRVISISVPTQLDTTAKKAAFTNGESYSGFITRAMQMALLRIESTKRPVKPSPKVKPRATPPRASTRKSTPASKPAAKPMASSARENDPCHHMRREPNGNWRLHFTVDKGPGSTAQLVDLSLRTSSEELAREHRDVVLMAIEKARKVVVGNHES